MTSEEIQRDIAKIRILRAQTTAWRTGLTGTFVVITIISSIALWCSFNNLAQDGPPKQQFINELSSNMQENIIPDAIGIGKDAVSQIDIQEEFSKLNNRAPDVANAAASQVKLLAKNLPDECSATLDTQFDSAMKDRESQLKTEFPQATDDQLSSLMTDITSEAHDQVQLAAQDMFTPHVTTLNNIVTDLNKIETEENPSKTEIPTWQMVFMVADIARADFADVQVPSGNSTKKLKS